MPSKPPVADVVRVLRRGPSTTKAIAATIGRDPSLTAKALRNLEDEHRVQSAALRTGQRGRPALRWSLV